MGSLAGWRGSSVLAAVPGPRFAALRDRGAIVTGVDRMAGMLEVARRRGYGSKCSGRAGFSESEVVGLIEAERRAAGVGALQLRIAKVFAGSVEAVLAAARVERLPRTA
jgi:hypothetical protein